MRTITTMALLAALAGCTERTDLVDRDAKPLGQPRLLSGLELGISTGRGRCLPRMPPLRMIAPETLVTTATVIETPAPGASCDPAHGRHPRADGRCLVDQVAVRDGLAPPAGAHGFYFTTYVAENPTCHALILFTPGDDPAPGAAAGLYGILTTEGDAGTDDPPGTLPVGTACDPSARAQNCDGQCPLQGTEVYVEVNNRQCASGFCTAYRYDETTDPARAFHDQHVHCNCRCGVPDSLRDRVDPATLCACPAGLVCTPMLGEEAGPELAGSYCEHPDIIFP